MYGKALRIPSSKLMTIAERVRELRHRGEKIIDMALGQPDNPPPLHVVVELFKAALETKPEYEDSAGLWELRHVIAKRLYLDDGTEITPDQVIITAGAKHALMMAIMAIISDGDEVLLPTPTFPAYNEIVLMAGGSPVYYRLEPANGWSPNLIDIEKKLTGKTKVLVLNYPHNPTGWEPSKELIQKILEITAAYDIYIISDEVYEKIIIKDEIKHYHITHFKDFSDKCIMVNSFSKTYGMVAYRLGYIVSPQHLVEQLIKLQRSSITNVSPIIQRAGLSALTGPQEYILIQLKKYRKRIMEGVKVLRDCGLECVEPVAGFYLFPRLSALNMNSEEFALRLLEEEKIAVTPGSVFGEEWIKYIRLALTLPDEEIDEAFTRISNFIFRYRKVS